MLLMAAIMEELNQMHTSSSELGSDSKAQLGTNMRTNLRLLCNYTTLRSSDPGHVSSTKRSTHLFDAAKTKKSSELGWAPGLWALQHSLN